MIQTILKHKLAFSLLIAFLYQFICIFQGLDLSDEGWLMYFYQQIFKNPECVVSQMPYWFTGIIGGLWYKLYPDGGFFSMRLLGIIINTGMMFIIYKFLIKFVQNHSLVLIGLLAQIIIIAGDPKPFGYNPLSAFFAIIAIITIYNGLEKKKTFYFFIAGIILGLNIFVRLPNIVYIGFLLLIPIYYYLKEKRISIFNRELFVSLSGIILAIITCIFLMKTLSHWDYFISAFTETIDIASDETNSHQIGQMISVYLYNYKKAFYVALYFLFMGILYLLISKHSKNKALSVIIQVIFFLVLSYFSLEKHQPFSIYDMFFVRFVSLFGVLLLIINWSKEKYGLKFLGIASLMMVLLLPVGSDKGIQVMWTSTWVSLPFAVSYIYQRINDIKIKTRKYSLKIPSKNIKEYFWIVALVFFITGIYKVDNKSYYDPSFRFERVYPINNKYTKAIYTQKHKAERLNQLLEVLPNYIKPNDYLLAYDYIPGLNFMTDTKSFTNNSWLYGYSGNRLEIAINKTLKKTDILPVIVRHHFLPIHEWGEYDPEFYDENHSEKHPYFRQKRIRTINNFIKEYKYRTAWTNFYFEILVPPNFQER